MKNTIKKVYVIYTETDQDIAQKVIEFLSEKIDNNRTLQESAVVILSDDAVKDSDWQCEVRALDKKVRRIPIGQTVDADYSDPEIIPPEIEQINFINIDDSLLNNIWESLTLPEGFYDVRNTVLVNMNSWIISNKSDAFLLSGYFRVKKYKRMVRERIAAETDGQFRYQLTEMSEYLKASQKRARKTLFKTIRRNMLIFFLSLSFVGMIFGGVYIIRNLNRAVDEMSILGEKTDQTNLAENAVRIADGVGNPWISGDMRYEFFDELRTYLDMNWCTAPVGLNYKYQIFAPQICPNPRYLITIADNGHRITWDTYSGDIMDDKSSEIGFLAAHISQDAETMIAVTSDKRIFFYKNQNWMTNNVEYSFSGNQDILIQTNNDHALIYDDKNAYYFEMEPDDFQLRYYMTRETVKTEDYKIYSDKLTEDGYIIALEINGGLRCEQLKENNRILGFDLKISVHENCEAVVNEQGIVFFNTDGDLMFFDAGKDTLESVGLSLPAPQFLCSANSDVIVYYDKIMGTHMYNIRRGYEIGTLFEGYEDLTFLDVQGSTAVCQVDGAYTCQSIENILPLDEIDDEKIVNRFEGKKDIGIGQVRSVMITDDKYVKVIVVVGEELKTYIFDGGRYMHTGYAITDSIEIEESDIKKYYEPYSYYGSPTVVGIIDDGYGIIIGAEDGSFCEMLFREDGSVLKEGSSRVPSHCSITGVYEMNDCYYLRDEAGQYWKARLGYPGSEDNTYLLTQVGTKFYYHHGISQDLINSVSKDTVDSLHLTVAPGSDGKEWE